LKLVFLAEVFSIDAISKNKKWTAIAGVRYRTTVFVVTKILKLIIHTAFADIQTNINYEASKWQWSFLGNISQNKYQYQPLTSNQFQFYN
jgi:hypothetical protein